MTTATFTKEMIQSKITTNPTWATRAILTIYARQTADEQATESTNHRNGQGFTGSDADILSSFAKQIQSGHTLSQKQLALAYKKLYKYAGQLVKVINEKGATK
jgi:hypothetical protein